MSRERDDHGGALLQPSHEQYLRQYGQHIELRSVAEVGEHEQDLGLQDLGGLVDSQAGVAAAEDRAGLAERGLSAPGSAVSYDVERHQ